MQKWYSRTELILGSEAIKRLSQSRVAVFGIGGVGGYAVEALARSGVGAIDVIDSDRVDVTNINRQIIATVKTVGRYKVDVAAERICDINPECKVRAYKTFILPETTDEFDFSHYDYVVDAIDTVTGKLALIKKAKAEGVPVISSMGAGNKLDPSSFKVKDISKTSVCPLAKVIRRELRKLGINGLKVVYSEEEPVKPLGLAPDKDSRTENAIIKRETPGSVSFVPSVVGLIIAGEVVKDLINLNQNNK